MGYTHDKLEMKEHRNIVDTITDVLSEDGHSQAPLQVMVQTCH